MQSLWETQYREVIRAKRSQPQEDDVSLRQTTTFVHALAKTYKQNALDKPMSLEDNKYTARKHVRDF